MLYLPLSARCFPVGQSPWSWPRLPWNFPVFSVALLAKVDFMVKGCLVASSTNPQALDSNSPADLAWILDFLIAPGGSDSNESSCNVGDPGSISGLGRSPGEGNGNSFQYSYLENYMDGGALWATVRGVTKSWTWLKWLSMPHAQIQYVLTEGLFPMAQSYFSSNFLCLWIQHLLIPWSSCQGKKMSL